MIPGRRRLITTTVDYGDGTGVQPLPLVGTSFALGHNYADSGEYITTVKVVDQSGLADSAAFKVTVENLPPVVHVGVDQVASEQAPVTILGNFTDTGLGDTHTATINWGDGTIEAAPVVEHPFGPQDSPAGMSGAVKGTHVYTGVGTFKVLITVTDKDGVAASDSFMVAVNSNWDGCRWGTSSIRRTRRRICIRVTWRRSPPTRSTGRTARSGRRLPVRRSPSRPPTRTARNLICGC